MAIRGPIGPPRQDIYAQMLAAFASGPRKEPLSAADFMTWVADNAKPPVTTAEEGRKRRRNRVRRGGRQQ